MQLLQNTHKTSLFLPHSFFVTSQVGTLRSAYHSRCVRDNSQERAHDFLSNSDNSKQTADKYNPTQKHIIKCYFLGLLICRSSM